MPTWSQVRLELVRVLTRRSTLGLLPTYSIISAAVVLLNATRLQYEWSLTILSLVLPCLFAPWAARVANRDRDVGMATILSSVPLSRAGEVIAKVAAVLMVAVASIVCSWLIVLSVSPNDLYASRALEYGAWAVCIGATNALLGYCIGIVFVRQALPGVLTAAGVAAAEVGVTSVAPHLLTQGWWMVPGFSRALHLSPPLWAAEAMGYLVEYRVDVGPLFVLGPLALVGVIAMCTMALTAAQDRESWSLDVRPRRVALTGGILAALLLLGAALTVVPQIGAAPIAQTPGGTAVASFVTNEHGDIVSRFERHTPFVDMLHGEHAFLHVLLRAEPNASIQISDVDLASRNGEVTLISPIPSTLVASATGVGSLEIPFQVTPAVLDGAAVDVRAVLQTDHGTFRASAIMLISPLFDQRTQNIAGNPATLAAASVPTLVGAGAWITLPGRLNRWPK